MPEKNLRPPVNAARDRRSALRRCLHQRRRLDQWLEERDSDCGIRDIEAAAATIADDGPAFQADAVMPCNTTGWSGSQILQAVYVAGPYKKMLSGTPLADFFVDAVYLALI